MIKVIIHAIPRESANEVDVTSLDDMLEFVEISDREAYSLKEMQGIVGGLIDILGSRLNSGTPVAMVINDEGKLDKLPFNPLATMLAIEYGMISEDDFIVGDVLLAYDTGDELRPFTVREYFNLCPVPDERQYILRLFLNRDEGGCN